MEDVEEVKKKNKGKQSRYGKRYGLEFKLRCVKLRLEEGIPISLLSKEAGASKDCHSSLDESVSGTGRSWAAERGCPGAAPAEASRTRTRENRRDQETRTPFWSQADLPSFEARVLPQRFSGDGAADAGGRIIDRSLQEETPPQHYPSSFF